MQNKSAYHYDFSYSLALDPIDTFQTSSPDSPFSPSSLPPIQHSFQSWLQILTQIKLLKQPQPSRSQRVSINKQMSFLFRIPAYRKLGKKLVRLCGIIHGIIDVEDKDHQIQKCRQSVYNYWQQLCSMLGEDKNKFVNIVVLCLFAVVFRVLEAECELEEQFVVFHTVYWEIKGQLTNKQTMEALISQIFNVDLFHKFMFWDQQELRTTYCAETKIVLKKQQKANSNIMPTFRASLAYNEAKKQGKGKQMYQSFKQIQQNLLQRKQKQNENTNYIPVPHSHSSYMTQPSNTSEPQQRQTLTNIPNFNKKQQKSNTTQYLIQSIPIPMPTPYNQNKFQTNTNENIPKINGYPNWKNKINQAQYENYGSSTRFSDMKNNLVEGVLSFRDNRVVGERVGYVGESRRDTFRRI